MPNPNMRNANMPNVTVPNLKMSTRHSPECNNVTTRHSPEFTNVTTRHSPECNNVPNCNVTHRQIVDFSLQTKPYRAALFSDNFALRGVLRLG
jgi:hypothetical protein